MRWNKAFFCAIVTLLSVSLLACGPTKPTYDEIETNIDNPSAKIDGKSASSAWSGYKAQQQSSGFTADNGVKFLTARDAKPVALHDYLVKAGIPKSILPAITPHLPHKNDYSQNPTSTQQTGNLVAKQFSFGIPGCFSVSGNVNGAEKEGRVSINLKCSGKGSGTLVITYRGWDDKAGELEFHFKNVCDKQGDCVNGLLGIKASTSGTSLARSGKVLYAYNFTATADGRSARAKGGFRLAYDGQSQYAKMEVVSFFKVDGEEVSAVLLFQRKGEEASFSLRGQNGLFECKTSDGGKTGTCTGTGAAGGSGEFSWQSEF